MTLDAMTIRHLEPALLGYARKRVGRADLAEDLVQETWAAALPSLDSFAGRSSLRTWLVAILRRKIVDQHRRRRIQVPFEDYLVVEPSDVEIGDEPLSRKIDRSAALDRIEEALLDFPPRERTAIVLCDVQGEEREEVARQLNISLGNLRVLLHRARARLREVLERSGQSVH